MNFFLSPEAEEQLQNLLDYLETSWGSLDNRQNL